MINVISIINVTIINNVTVYLESVFQSIVRIISLASSTFAKSELGDDDFIMIAQDK